MVQGVDVLQFAFRWLNCLFLREFSAKCIPRLMVNHIFPVTRFQVKTFVKDTYLAEGDDLSHFIEHFCLVILLKWSAQVRRVLKFQADDYKLCKLTSLKK